jgi:hypothetical protein
MWQTLKNEGDVMITQRMKVPGGWLVRTMVSEGDNSVSLAFIPDATWSWGIEDRNWEIPK